jgi:hypothetical protein
MPSSNHGAALPILFSAIPQHNTLMSLAHLIQRTEARVAFRAPALPKSAALQRQRGDDFETYGRIAHCRTVAQARRGSGIRYQGLSRACVAGSINLIMNSLYNINSQLTFFFRLHFVALSFRRKASRNSCKHNLSALLSRCPQAGATGREDALGNEQANADILRRFSNLR